MNTILNIFLINLICIIIIDQAKFPDEIKKIIAKWVSNGKREDVDYSLKPLDCSLCSTFWLSIIYLIISGNLSLLTIAISLLISNFSKITNDFITLIMDILTKIIYKIYDKIE